jgi:soluble lytic murein transglycosylase-like protein
MNRCLLIILLVLAFSLPCNKVKAELINLTAIAKIESNNNPLAVSKAGAVGLYQLMPCVLQDYNKYKKTSYTLKNLYNPLINKKIASWYLNDRIPKMLKYYLKKVSIKNVLWAYNAGIGNVVKNKLPIETKNYLIKYDKLTKK